MSADMKSYVSELLEGYRARERKIAVLRYDLEHPSEVGVTEQIEAMNYGSGEGVGHSKGHISNKTLYIALNYEEQAKQLNAESAKEIADELFILERSIPVTRKTRQLKKEEPHDKIEMHLGGCNNPIKPEVHHGLYTEYQDCTSYRENFSCGCGYR